MYFCLNSRKNEESPTLKYAPFDYHEVVQPLSSLQRLPQEEVNMTDGIIFTDQPNLKVFCHDCRRQISKTATILSFNSIYRCVGCFAKLQPSAAPYKVIKSLNFSLVDHNWKASYQILFLNLLEKHGFNNWADIRQQMDFYGAKFSIPQLQNHYYQCYLGNDEFLPKILNNDNFFQKKQERPLPLKTSIHNNTIISLPTTHQEQQPEIYEDIEDYQVEQIVKNKREKNREKDKENYYQFYNEKRREFDVEYDSDAELMLADLEFREDDSEQEMRIKLQLIQIYNQRVEKRQQLKNFIVEHRLLDQTYQKEKHRLRNDLQKEAFEQLKPIARFTTLSEYNELTQKVAFTKQLKSIIEGLRRFRRNHPSNFNSLEEFLRSHPQQSKPKKKLQTEVGSMKTGKKVEQMLQKRFHITKRQFQNIVSNLAGNRKRTVYKNIQAVMLSRNYE